MVTFFAIKIRWWILERNLMALMISFFLLIGTFVICLNYFEWVSYELAWLNSLTSFEWQLNERDRQTKRDRERIKKNKISHKNAFRIFLPWIIYRFFWCHLNEVSLCCIFVIKLHLLIGHNMLWYYLQLRFTNKSNNAVWEKQINICNRFYLQLRKKYVRCKR